jgi:hypothetical protein
MTTTTTTTTIRTALEAEKANAAASFTQYVNAVYTRLVELVGDTSEAFKGIARGRKGEYYQSLHMAISPLLTRSEVEGVERCRLVEHRIAAAAAEYADQTIDQMITKLEGKIGDLHEVEVLKVSPGASGVTLRGLRGGDVVAIEQRQILNCSPKGKLFNQYPALIYVNGKKTSEAAYKRAA